MKGRLASLVADALACIARECPGAYEGMRRALGDREIMLQVGEEAFSVALTAPGRETGPPVAYAAIEIRTSERDGLSVLRGELDVIDALLSGALSVRGPADDLIRGGDAMTCFLKGAMRCTSMESLLDRLEEHSTHREVRT